MTRLPPRGSGVWECGPLYARIDVTYVFDRAAYERALTHPGHLPRDPFA
ncbi:hypothetical protein AB0D45_01140 [Streptomyces sp. NPDC048352]